MLRNLTAVLLIAMTVFIVVSVGAAAQRLVDRHYDYLAAEQQNTMVERRVEALHEATVPAGADGDDGAGGTLMGIVLVSIAVMLAMTVLIGQGGVNGLLNNANKLVRSLKRKPKRRSRAAPAPDRDRYIVSPPARSQMLPAPDEDDGTKTGEDIRWV